MRTIGDLDIDELREWIADWWLVEDILGSTLTLEEEREHEAAVDGFSWWDLRDDLVRVYAAKVTS